MSDSKHRPIRSFVLRGGRLTSAQQHALDELWPHYGIEPRETVLEFEDHFENPGDVIVEIGFGSARRVAVQTLGQGRNVLGHARAFVGIRHQQGYTARNERMRAPVS